MDSSLPPNCEPPSWCQYQRLVDGDTVNEHMSLSEENVASTVRTPDGTAIRSMADESRT
nr:hypothetical protein [Deltaproteobacteria bacterium]